MSKTSLIAVGMVFLCQPCVAADWSGFRTIQEFGCHKVDGTCYMTIDGPPVTGGAGCTSNSVRWDLKDDAGGKNWLALVMLAKSLNKRVGVAVDGCYLPEPMFPTFAYGYIE
jgi:hypothetical protein